MSYYGGSGSGSNEYDDNSNNPYHAGEHGGSSTASSAQPSTTSQWFCHACQADFTLTDEQLARSGAAACPQCRGEFVEQTAESADDPHEFDRVPENPFAMFGMGGGQPGVAGQALPSGPFGALLQQMMGGGMMYPGQGHPHGQPRAPEERSASAPPAPSNPAEAAAQAAERRAGGLSPEPSGSSSTTLESSSSGTYRSGSTTFIWNNSNSSQQPPRSPTPQQANNAPVRNLASFLSDAFRSPTSQTEQRGPTSPLQEGPAQRAPNFGGGDPLAAFLAQLAGTMGVPLGAQPGEAGQAEGGQQPPPQQGGEPGAAGPPRAARVIIGNPTTGGAGVMTFTFGGGPGGQGGEGAMGGFPFLPFMMGGGGGQGTGQAGDYVFTQGALDNIITELMNQANGRYGPQPASEETIKNLPKVEMTKELVADDAIQDCAVCKDNFEEGDMASKLPCNHLFHCDCIQPWLERSGTCPVCRYQLVEQPEPPRGPGEPSPAPGPEGDTPVSPNTPRSPPIQGGSSMPGSFPFGQFFSSIGNFMTGGSSIGTSGSGSEQQREGQSGTNPSASGSSRQQGANQTRDEPQGQPDMDLDLD